MQSARARRTTWAIAASALAHLVVLFAALSHHFTLRLQAEETAGSPQAIIPVLLIPRAPPSNGAPSPQPSAVQLHRRPQRPDETSQPSAPLRAPPSERATVQAPHVAEPSAQAQAQPPSGAAVPDLRAILRRGVLGCASTLELSRAERERCNEELARGAASASALPLDLSPKVRAYYDAVAEAKKQDPPLVPRVAPGSLGYFDQDKRTTRDHPPMIGCYVPFGPGEKPKLPSHWLTLGPCFIAPPKGSLTPEADITPP